MEPKILVVDDDEMVIFLHKAILREGGFTDEPLISLNGKKALEIILTSSTPKFVVFLDLNMPIMNGWALLDEMQNHAHLNEVKVVIVTSSIADKDKEKSLKYSHVIGYLEKPLRIEDCKRLKRKLGDVC